MIRAALRSTRGRLVCAAIVIALAWQIWLTLAAPAKIEHGLVDGTGKVNVLVTLPFPPERFHMLAFQRYGRVSGAQDRSIELRGVARSDLYSVARPYWVTKVEALPPEGKT